MKEVINERNKVMVDHFPEGFTARIKIKFLFHQIIFIFFCMSTWATEVDSFTNRTLPLGDSLIELNKIANGYLIQTIKLSNQKESCDPWVFYENLFKQMGGFFISQIEIDVQKSNSIDKRVTKRAESIYKNVSLINSPAMLVADLADLMRVDNVFFGGDKLNHFFHMGFLYFEIVYKNRQKITHAHSFGEFSENTYFGLATGGIYSYADLAANLDGFYFYEKLINDPKTTLNSDPYVSCHKGKWKQERKFNWKEYINPAWDEAINCNDYINQEMSLNIANALQELEKSQGKKFSCPLSFDEVQKIFARYGDHAPRVVSPKLFLHTSPKGQKVAGLEGGFMKRKIDKFSWPNIL